MTRTDEQLWTLTHRARAGLASDLAGLSEQGWRTPSLCGEWDVEHVVAHLTAAATVGRWRWLASIVGSGFRPAVHNQRRLREHLGATPAETLEAFEAVIEARIAPSGDLPAFLGEVVVHAEDVRVPLGIETSVDPEAALAVAEFYAAKDFAVPSKSTVKGLRLEATDGPFAAGEGPVVSGPTLALVMAMAGRGHHLSQLDGEGVTILRDRVR